MADLPGMARFLSSPMTTMLRRMRSLRFHAMAAAMPLGLGCAVLAAAAPRPAAAQAVDFPRPGLVCDGSRQICYDRQGPSLALTRQYFGPGAANQLLAQLSGRPPQREFMLSSGQLCDLSAGSCWDDGWRRGQVNVLLSRHLFGVAPAPAAGPMPGSIGLPGPQNPPGRRLCQLSQRGLPVFNGPCRLFRQNDGSGLDDLVQMGSGQQFRFQRRGSLLVLSDASGTWPVFPLERGNSVQFRWANLLLEVTRPMQARGGMPDGTATPGLAPRSTGESRQDLIDSLFE